MEGQRSGGSQKLELDDGGFLRAEEGVARDAQEKCIHQGQA